MKRYLALWLVITTLLIGAVAAMNVAVDPYRLYRDDVGITKPRAGPNGAVTKTYAVQRIAPGALVLGNSRAEIGFDPRHPAWPSSARPVYNLALPGTGVGTSLQSLRRVLDAPGPRVGLVVLGLDVQDYLVEGPAPPPTQAREAGAARAPLLDPLLLSRMRDYGRATFTVDALTDSLATLAARRDPDAADLDDLGFNPMRDYVRLVAEEGHWRLFHQKDLENSRAWLRRPAALRHADGSEGGPLATLRRIVALCRQHGVELRLAIYPYHAHQLEIIDATGHWAVFEDWKRALATLASATDVPLWDFAGYDDFTTEPVPARGDRKTAMRWYWEGGHFKKELGDRVLQAVLGGHDTGFGERLSTDNVEARIAAVRAQRAAYRASPRNDAQQIRELVAGLRPNTGAALAPPPSR